MPFIVKPIEEIKTEILNPTVDKINQGDKMDVVLVILIVLLMFVFRSITAFLFKAIGAVIIAIGLYTLFLT
jgi:hypothetical protein